MTKILYCSLENGVKKIILNRPEKRNALSKGMIEEFLVALKLAEKEATVLMIEGAGDCFCSGLDLNELSAALFRKIGDLYLSLAELSCPTIALVKGVAAAGGIGLIAACDFAYAEKTSSYFLPELKKGVLPALVGVLLRSCLSERHFKELAFSSRKMSAERAYEIGLLNGIGFEENGALVSSLLEVDRDAFSLYKKHLNKKKMLENAFQEALALQEEILLKKI